MTALAGPRPENLPGQARADVLTAEEFAVRVQIRRVHTVTDLCADGVVPGASKIGRDWRVHWPTFYAAVAGPGVPDGEVVTSRQLARYLRVDERVVRRAAAAPGTPGRLPGFQLGKTWLHAMRAVNAMTGWSQPGAQNTAAPGTGPVPARWALPGTALDFPAPVLGQAPARAPGRGAAAARRRPAASPTTRATP